MMNGYWLEVHQPILFITAVVNHFPNNAYLSLEGDLSQCDLSLIDNHTTTETALLKRYTLQPKQDFAILPLNTHTRAVMVQRIFPQVGLRNRVQHIGLEQAGELVLVANDWLDSVWLISDVEAIFLERLQETAVLKGYTKAT